MQHLPEAKLAELKRKLEAELKQLTAELQGIGRKNPTNPADWEARPPEDEVQPGDYNEAADKIEGYEENTAILKELEVRYANVKSALERLEKGAYGLCEVSGEPIELERLEANPAARTCMKHRDQDLPVS